MPNFVLTPSSTPSATADIEVIARAATSLAPEGIVFGINNFSGFTAPAPAGGIYDRRMHELYYFWDFGDAYSFVAPDRVLDKSANTAYGPNASHVFRAAGDYTVTCTIHEPATGAWAIASSIIVVGAAITGANTVFMSPSGTFTNAPAGATQVTSGDVDAVIVSHIEGQEGTPKRLMLASGEAFTLSGHTFGAAALTPTIHIVSDGVGARPEIVCTNGFSWNDVTTVGAAEVKDVVLQNLSLTGPLTDALNMWTSNGASQPASVLMDGIVGEDWDIMTFGSSPCDIINDSTFTNWRSAGLNNYGDGVFACLGSSVKSPPGIGVHLGDGMGAPYRGLGAYTIFDACDIHSRQGWTSSGGRILSQAALRINDAEAEGNASTVARCVIEGGQHQIWAKNGGEGVAKRANHVWSNNYLLGTFSTYNSIGFSQAGTTIRNNVMVYPNITYNAPGPITFVSCDYLGGDLDNRADPINIYNNTCVNLSDSAPLSVHTASDGFSAGGGAFTGVVENNNIQHQPNASTPDTTYAPLADSASLFLPESIGYLDGTISEDFPTGTPHYVITATVSVAFTEGNTLTNGTASATIYRIDGLTLWLGPVTGGAFSNTDSLTESDGSGAGTATSDGVDAGQAASFAPEPGSSALNPTLTGLIAFDDFYGIERLSGSEDIGAVQVTT